MTGLVVLLLVALLLVGGYEALARTSPTVASPLGHWSQALQRLADRARGLTGRRASGTAREVTPGDVAALLAPARSVVVVPGFGLAAAQGQHAARDLAEALSGRGADVTFALHPAAGRMPGHLDAVLDDAQVPPSAVVTGPEAAARLRVADVALVVGAGDVVTAASGLGPLPVLHAAHVVVLARGDGAGRSGAANPLLADPAVAVLRGDARESLGRVLEAVRAG